MRDESSLGAKVNAIDVVVIAGSPGTGKSTLMRGLEVALDLPPTIEFSDLREWHLDSLWLRQSTAEEAMAFDNLMYVVRNYVRHEMTPVLVTDFEEHRVQEIADCLTVCSSSP